MFDKSISHISIFSLMPQLSLWWKSLLWKFHSKLLNLFSGELLIFIRYEIRMSNSLGYLQMDTIVLIKFGLKVYFLFDWIGVISEIYLISMILRKLEFVFFENMIAHSFGSRLVISKWPIQTTALLDKAISLIQLSHRSACILWMILLFATGQFGGWVLSDTLDVFSPTASLWCGLL